MRNILLFGAGKSATVLIDYLLNSATNESWDITVVDADLRLGEMKIKGSSHGKALSFDIYDTDKRNKSIEQADIVISLLPPDLHYIVAENCIKLNKNLLTASYVDDKIRNLEPEIINRQLLFLYEMGLDPGIDHMSAMKLIENIHETGGKVTSFISHCGGLVAPESDDNPWHYKISWNPRNIVMAGKAGALFKENGNEKHLKYEELFNSGRMVEIPEIGFLSWYPNRNSLSYAPLYGLETADTFIRTTLRHPDFIYGWKNVIDLQLTDETSRYETNGKVLSDFFTEHIDKNNFKKMMVSEKDEMSDVETGNVKSETSSAVTYRVHDANLTLKQLFFLGMDDDKTQINKGVCSAADVLQLVLEKKLALQPGDKDMIVMMHEMKYKTGNTKYELRSSLIVKGDDNIYTAMAKTVGLPLGIAAKLILNGTIKLKGLHIPTRKEIYEPVLNELEKHGIKFKEEIILD